MFSSKNLLASSSITHHKMRLHRPYILTIYSSISMDAPEPGDGVEVFQLDEEDPVDVNIDGSKDNSLTEVDVSRRNWCMQVISALGNHLPPGFNFETFYSELSAESSTIPAEDEPIEIIEVEEVTNAPEYEDAGVQTDLTTTEISKTEAQASNYKMGYELSKKEQTELKRKLTLYQAEREVKTFQVAELQTKIEELQDSTTEIQNLKSKIEELTSGSNVTIEIDDNRRLIRRESSTRFPTVELELSKTVSYFETESPRHLCIYKATPLNFPTKEEREQLKEQENKLKAKYRALKRQLAKQKEHMDNIKAEMGEKDQEISKLNEQVQQLRKDLHSEQIRFEEELRMYKQETEARVETCVLKREQSRAILPEAMSPQFDDDIAILEHKIDALEQENKQLANDLADERASCFLLDKKNEYLKAKLEELENKSNTSPASSNKKEALNKYSSSLRIKYNELQTKYEDLQKEYNELKRTRHARFDPLMMSRNIEANKTIGDHETEKKLKQCEARNEALKKQNEELQRMLEKSTANVERLSQLVTRKETQLTAFHEQMSELKQQLLGRSKRCVK